MNIKQYVINDFFRSKIIEIGHVPEAVVRLPGLGLSATNGLSREVREELLMWQLVGIGNMVIVGQRENDLFSKGA